MTHVTIDARMLHTAGIGTYIRHLVPRVVARWSDASFTILGDPAPLLALVPQSTRVVIREFDVPIYSIREQIHFLRVIPSHTSLVWVPHYNIPVLYRGRLAATVHDLNHLAIPAASRLRRAYARTMFRAVRRRARVVLCDSRFTAEELARYVGAPREMATIHLGVDAHWFELQDRTPLAEPYFLYVGNVKPHKNLPRLLEAFARIAPSIEHRLVIIGRREGMLTTDPRVASMADALGERVVFTGFMEQPEMEAYMRGCAGLVLPSLYEGFGFPPLEAMACGRPVAVSRAGSLPEICGPEALYFDPMDVDDIAAALRRLAAGTSDDAPAQARRRAWARQFDWDRCAIDTIATLRRAAGETIVPGSGN